MSPLTILDLITTQHKIDIVIVNDQDPSIDSWLKVGVCGYYRTASANDQGNYIRDLTGKIYDLMVTDGHGESTHVKRTPAF